MLLTSIKYHSADLYNMYTMYNLADIRWDVKQYYVILLSTYLTCIWTECSQQVACMPEENWELMAQVIVIHSLWEVLGRSSSSGATMKEEDGHEHEHGGNIFGIGDACQPTWKSADCGEKGVEDIGQIDYSDGIAQTAAIVHYTFSPSKTTNSIPASPLIPPLLELDSFVQPDDSASVTSSASTGLRSGYECEGDEFQKDDTPVYQPNVDYWRKNILQYMDGLPLEEPMLSQRVSAEGMQRMLFYGLFHSD